MSDLKWASELTEALIIKQRLEIEKDEEMSSKKPRAHKNAYNWYQ